MVDKNIIVTMISNEFQKDEDWETHLICRESAFIFILAIDMINKSDPLCEKFVSSSFHISICNTEISEKRVKERVAHEVWLSNLKNSNKLIKQRKKKGEYWTKRKDESARVSGNHLRDLLETCFPDYISP